MKKVLFVFLAITVLEADQSWAKTYKKVYSQQEMFANRTEKALFFKNHQSIPFTQLIFSWNAHRPSKGKLHFYARVRDAKTKKWDTWHEMVEWGSEAQKSYFSRGTHSCYNYARLEMNAGKKGDAFEIKAATSGNVNLGAIKGLIVTASDFTQFTPEPYALRAKGLSTHILEDIVPKSQMEIDDPRANTMCSPTSLSMVVQALSGQETSPHSVARYVYDEGLDAFGNWGFNMAHAFEQLDSDALFYTTRLSSFGDLHSLLQQNIPVAVSVRGSIAGAKKEYNNGHLLVVTGFDAKNKKVICHDPAFDTAQEVRKEYDLHDFVVAWERSRRLTYKAEALL